MSNQYLPKSIECICKERASVWWYISFLFLGQLENNSLLKLRLMTSLIIIPVVIGFLFLSTPMLFKMGVLFINTVMKFFLEIVRVI